MLADLVLLEGKILTMNPLHLEAEAVAIKGEKIIKVGSTQAVSTFIGKDTKVVRLSGKTAIPGIIDTHIHVADFGRILSWLNLENVRSIKEMKQCLARRVKIASEGKWVIGRGWDQTRFAENRYPNLADLDDVAPNNPVVLYHESGQVCIINTKASELTDIANQSTGEKTSLTAEFTGILRDEETNLVWNVIPSPNEEEVFANAALACQKIIEAGITSVHWMVLSPIEVGIIQKLYDQNLLLPRAYAIIPANIVKEVLETRSKVKSKLLKFGGAEIFADGYLAAETAALSKPYNDNPSERGKLLCSSQEMAKMATEIEAVGLQVLIHAMGDKAIDAALSTIEQVQKSNGDKVLRCRIEQAAVLREELLERMKKEQVIVSIQPRVVASEFSVWSALKRLGSRRASWLFPLKSLVRNGICVVAGSDCPMEPLSPMLGFKLQFAEKCFLSNGLMY